MSVLGPILPPGHIVLPVSGNRLTAIASSAADLVNGGATTTDQVVDRWQFCAISRVHPSKRRCKPMRCEVPSDQGFAS